MVSMRMRRRPEHAHRTTAAIAAVVAALLLVGAVQGSGSVVGAAASAWHSVFPDRPKAYAEAEKIRQFLEAVKSGDTFLAQGLLSKAIDAYLKGFEADWRDAYPGINAVTLMELKEPPDPRREKLIPVVVYAVERRIAGGKPDYWDHATRLELAVLAKDEHGARNALDDALAAVREVWEPETTARSLRLIREARERRGEMIPWAKEIEEDLERRAKSTQS